MGAVRLPAKHLLLIFALFMVIQLVQPLSRNQQWLILNRAIAQNNTSAGVKAVNSLVASSLPPKQHQLLQQLVAAKLDPTNLVINGGFEFTEQNWVIAGAPGILPGWSDEQARTGQYALKVTFIGSDVNFYQAFQEIVVLPNVCYHLLGYILPQQLTDGVALEVWDADRGYDYWYGGRTNAVAGSASDWVSSSLDFCTPDDVERIQIRLRRYSGTPVSGTAWFDDIRLERTVEN